MDRYTIFELIGGVMLVGLLVFFVDPFMLWMPSMVVYSILAFVLIGFGIFGGMVWREQTNDEREEFHAMRASRMAYLAGLTTLVIGAVYQASTAMIDVWLFAAIAIMVIVKLATRIYASICS